MDVYHGLLFDVCTSGESMGDRTGTGRKSVFGRQIRFDLSEGFPILTSKKVYFKGVVAELLWFLRGDTSIEYLHQNGVRFWDEWVKADGTFGPIYGAQLRHRKTYDGKTFDQLSNVIESIKTNPFSRRHLMTTWDPASIGEMALPPCHGIVIQFHPVQRTGKLHLNMYQRSADIFLGVPFNISSYALMLHIVAHHTGYEPGELVMSFGDLHLYDNHEEQASKYLARGTATLPTLTINHHDDIMDYVVSDFGLEGYDPLPHIPAEVAV